MDAVVVAHGLWMLGPDTYLVRRRLRARGFEPYVFRYRSVGRDLDENAAELARFLRDVPGERVHLVGHSLGGVVILCTLAARGYERIGNIVCLGSPLKGSRAATGFRRLPAGDRMLGRSILGLLSRRGLPPWGGERPLGIIAGSLPLGLGRVLAELPEPHDGVVAVEETRLEGAADHLVLRVCHMGLLVSKTTLDQTACFLEHGRFCQERLASETSS